MSERQKDRACCAEISYWLGVFLILALSVLSICTFVSGDFAVNGFVMMVGLANIVVFLVRGVYALRHRAKLFSKKNYRATEQAANAERVALYAFVVIFVGGLITDAAEGRFDVDASVGAVGESVGVLILVTPVVTYLMSGYGKFRDIVQEDKSDRTHATVGAQSDQ